MKMSFSKYLTYITNHIEKYIGKIGIVYDEIQSDELHIDVHHIPPQKNRHWHTYITSGMSAIPMNIRKGFPTPNRAELMIYLPKNKPISIDNKYGWPLEMLKLIARYPKDQNTFITPGKAIHFGSEQKHFSPHTKFQGVLIYLPEPERMEFASLEINDNFKISFYTIIPLYGEEFDYYSQNGQNELLDRLTENGVTLILDNSRINVGLSK